MSFLCSLEWKSTEELFHMGSIFAVKQRDVSESDVCVLSHSKVLLRKSVWVREAMLNRLDSGWHKRREYLLIEMLGKDSNTINSVLSNISHVMLGPKGDLNKLLAKPEDQHKVLVIAIVDVLHEEERGILKFSLTHNSVLLENLAEVWADIQIDHIRSGPSVGGHDDI